MLVERAEPSGVGRVGVMRRRMESSGCPSAAMVTHGRLAAGRARPPGLRPRCPIALTAAGLLRDARRSRACAAAAGSAHLQPPGTPQGGAPAANPRRPRGPEPRTGHPRSSSPAANLVPRRKPIAAAERQGAGYLPCAAEHSQPAAGVPGRCAGRAAALSLGRCRYCEPSAGRGLADAERADRNRSAGWSLRRCWPMLLAGDRDRLVELNRAVANRTMDSCSRPR